MRTTLAIDDGLLSTAKHRARQQNVTLGQFVEAALQAFLSSQPEPRARRPLPTSTQPGGIRPGVDVRTNAGMWAVLDDDDVATLTARP